MTPTATYIAEENCLQELPQWEAPRPSVDGIFGPYAEIDRSRMIAYKNHLATLRKIPCSPEPGFKDGEKYTEGVDYEIKGAGDWKWCYQLKGNIFAAPIVPVSEDELWKEMLETAFRKYVIGKDVTFDMGDAVRELKKSYSLTKK